MELDRIKEHVNAVPFRPFTIEMTGGTQIEILITAKKQSGGKHRSIGGPKAK